jgi:hypothetical protein
MTKDGMDAALFWLVIFGTVLIGAGLSIWGFPDGNRTLALWVGFSGAVALLLCAALQIQVAISRHDHKTPRPIVPTANSAKVLVQCYMGGTPQDRFKRANKRPSLTGA